MEGNDKAIWTNITDNGILWVARDADGWLSLHLVKPHRHLQSWISECSYDLDNQSVNSETIHLNGDDRGEMFDRIFKNLTWEDEPLEVILMPFKPK